MTEPPVRRQLRIRGLLPLLPGIDLRDVPGSLWAPELPDRPGIKVERESKIVDVNMPQWVR